VVFYKAISSASDGGLQLRAEHVMLTQRRCSVGR
jgi:hypothetical protein